MVMDLSDGYYESITKNMNLSVILFNNYSSSPNGLLTQTIASGVLFFLFSGAMSSLNVFISSSVYVTIDPGTSSVVASPFCFVELWLIIFWAMFTVFSCFLVVASERS